MTGTGCCPMRCSSTDRRKYPGGSHKVRRLWKRCRRSCMAAVSALSPIFVTSLPPSATTLRCSPLATALSSAGSRPCGHALYGSTPRSPIIWRRTWSCWKPVARRAEEFDVIHSHVDYLGYPLLRRAGVPFLTTLHGRLDLPILQHIYRTFDDVPVVTISDAQREPVPNANYLGTIQHGIPERLLLPGFGAGGYLAFLGRISPEKAPDAAIRIAQKA